ncbi:S-methyl-5-thioribose kinase [Acidipropionibacterium timonense]|uniref:S-methyl-5-thioribose kinase n=1 Tax=Acidipropionibacterium timonense TaxID=2161818 RepID=UPI0010326DAF|nr:S-methyl-5-thioribose kinase [Acidipropionibacterium timonense]
MVNYEFLTEATIVDYLRTRIEVAGVVDVDRVESVREIGDGNLNLVFLVKDSHGRGLCVKQALPYVRMTGEGWPMTPDRARHEVESLQAHGALVPDLVPKVFFYDPSRYIFAMEDLSDHEVWRSALNKGEAHAGVAESVGRFMGACAFGTSALTLDRDQLAEATASSLNPQLCLITDDLVLTEPLVDAGRNSYLDANAPDVADFQADEAMLRAMGWAKWMFLTKAETLLHGDLHTGSVMVRKADPTDTEADSVKVFDSEFAFYGPQAFDLGAVWANLVLASSRAFALKEDDRALWLLKQIPLVWQGLETEFRRRWPERRDPRVFGDDFLHDLLFAWRSDAWLFAAAEMSRRIVGAAKVTDVQTLPENLREGAARGVLQVARRLVRQHEVERSPEALSKLAAEVLLAVRTA